MSNYTDLKAENARLRLQIRIMRMGFNLLAIAAGFILALLLITWSL